MASKYGKRIVPDDDIPAMTNADFAAAKSVKAEMPDVVEVMKRNKGPIVEILTLIIPTQGRSTVSRKAPASAAACAMASLTPVRGNSVTLT